MKSLWFVFGCLTGIFCTLSGSQAQTRTVTLALAGDLMMGRAVAEAHREDGWEGVFAAIVPELQAADLALGNLESPLDDPLNGIDSQSEFNLCADGSSADILAGAGFDILSIANNHRFDCNTDGPNITQSILSAADIIALDEYNSPLEMQIRGIKLAFMAFDDISRWLDEQELMAAIQNASKTNDVVVVSVHWGMEYQGRPSQRQRRLAEKMARAGADLIWGHHPHVLQPVEWVEREGGQSPTLVAYSLGNALFDQAFVADTRQSAVLRVSMDKEGITSVDATPFIIRWQDHTLDIPDSASRRSIYGPLNINQVIEKNEQEQ